MKLIEKNTNRVIEINMYIIGDTGMNKSNDIAADMFEGYVVSVDDADYCTEQVIDWVHGWGDYGYQDKNEKRMAIIDDVIHTNYEL